MVENPPLSSRVDEVAQLPLPPSRAESTGSPCSYSISLVPSSSRILGWSYHVDSANTAIPPSTKGRVSSCITPFMATHRQPVSALQKQGERGKRTELHRTPDSERFPRSIMLLRWAQSFNLSQWLIVRRRARDDNGNLLGGLYHRRESIVWVGKDRIWDLGVVWILK